MVSKVKQKGAGLRQKKGTISPRQWAPNNGDSDSGTKAHCLQVDVISHSHWQAWPWRFYFQGCFCAALNNIPCMAADREMRGVWFFFIFFFCLPRCQLCHKNRFSPAESGAERGGGWAEQAEPTRWRDAGDGAASLVGERRRAPGWDPKHGWGAVAGPAPWYERQPPALRPWVL